MGAPRGCRAHRSSAHWTHPALQSGDLREGVRRITRAIRKRSTGARTRLLAQHVLLQRRGRSVRGVRRRRARADRDGVPCQRVRGLRHLRRLALQTRDPRREAARRQHRASARVDRRPGDPAAAPPSTPGALSLVPAAGRARLPAARSAGHDAVGRRGPTPENCPGAGAHEGGEEAVYPRRTNHRAPPRRRARAVSRARSAGGCRAYRARDRAQHRRDQTCGLGDRSGTGGGRSGRARGGCRDTGGGRAGRRVGDRTILAGFGVTKRRADLLLITASAVWGVSFVIVKDALAAASPLLFLATRFTIATLVLASLVNLRAGFSRAELRAGALLTLLLASGFATQAFGLQYTTPARSAFIVAMSSVLAPMIALLVLRHRLAWQLLVALVVATLGLYFLTAPEAGGLNRGDLWTLVTAVVFGGHIVAVSEVSERVDAQRMGWLQLPGAAIRALIAAGVVEGKRFWWGFGVWAGPLFLRRICPSGG